MIEADALDTLLAGIANSQAGRAGGDTLFTPQISVKSLSEAVIQLAALKARVVELETKTYCLYCGLAFSIVDDPDEAKRLVAEHILTCEKHPIAGYRHRIDELEAEREWKPIENAPKDGTVIDLWWDGDRYDGWWDVTIKMWMFSQFDNTREEQPTFWKHLPQPPKESE